MYLSGSVYPLTIQGDTLDSPVVFGLPKRERKLTLTASCGEYREVIAKDTLAEEIRWIPPGALGAEYPGAERIPVTLTLASGGSTRRERMELEIPKDGAPALEVALSDEMGFLDAAGAYVQNVSRLRAAVQAEGRYGAEIAGIAVFCGSLTGNGSDLCFDLPQAGDVPVTVRATDSRGRYTDWQTRVSVLPYWPPQGGFRGGSADKMAYWASVCDVAGINQGSCTLVSLKNGTEQRLPLSTGMVMNGTCSVNLQYFGRDLWLEVTDRFATVRIPYVSAPLLDIDRHSRALGIGCFGEEADTVCIGLGVNLQKKPLHGLGDARQDTDALPLGQGDRRYLLPRLVWENPDPQAAFPPGEVKAEGTVFLIGAAPNAEADGLFWELGAPDGILRGEAWRPFTYENGALHFDTTPQGDGFSVPRKIYVLR